MPRVITKRLIIYLVLWLVAEMTLLRPFWIGSAAPLPLYLMVLYACLEWGWKTTIPVAFCAGLMRDLAGSAPFGVETSALVLSSLVLDLMVQKVEHSILLFRFAIAVIFMACVLGISYMLTLVLGSRTVFVWNDLSIWIGSAVYSAVLYPFFFYLTARWFKDRRVLKQYELFG